MFLERWGFLFVSVPNFFPGQMWKARGVAPEMVVAIGTRLFIGDERFGEKVLSYCHS